VIEWLPHVNVSLNSLATLLLIAGFVLIKQKREAAHRNVMLATFGVNITTTLAASNFLRILKLPRQLFAISIMACLPVTSCWQPQCPC
jgi:uncharacterized membrane protein YozB (DUF420 family)